MEMVCVQYRNPWNHIRMGRVLEDMDSMAGNIAFTHCDDDDPATLLPMLVTAAVERIEMIRSVDLEHDASLCAPSPCPRQPLSTCYLSESFKF